MGKIENSENLKEGIIPDNEDDRLKALDRYHILDSPSEETFHDLSKAVAQAFQMPIGIVSFTDLDRVFYKDVFGRDATGKNLPRNKSLCSLVVLSNEPTVITNMDDPCLLIDQSHAQKNGIKFYAGAPIRTPDGFNIGTVAVADFTAREFTEHDKKILVALAALAMRELEIRMVAQNEVNYATNALNDLRMELQLTREELTESNSELNNFLYRASHDLKGPLATIRGILNLAQREITDSASLNYLDKVSIVNANMNESLSKLVVIYSLLRSEEEMPMPKTYLVGQDIHQIIAQTLAQLKHEIEQKKIDVEVGIDVNGAFFNHQYIQLILSNLIENAVHFQKGGSHRAAKVKITAVQTTKEFQFTVYDNGEGVPVALQQRLFRLFVKGANSARSGMGLYIVKKLTEKLNGSVTLLTEVGEFTEFRIQLPL